MVAAIAAIVVIARQLDHFTGHEARTPVSVVPVGYMVGRGPDEAGRAIPRWLRARLRVCEIVAKPPVVPTPMPCE